MQVDFIQDYAYRPCPFAIAAAFGLAGHLPKGGVCLFRFGGFGRARNRLPGRPGRSVEPVQDIFGESADRPLEIFRDVRSPPMPVLAVQAAKSAVCRDEVGRRLRRTGWPVGAPGEPRPHRHDIATVDGRSGACMARVETSVRRNGTPASAHRPKLRFLRLPGHPPVVHGSLWPLPGGARCLFPRASGRRIRCADRLVQGLVLVRRDVRPGAGGIRTTLLCCRCSALEPAESSPLGHFGHRASLPFVRHRVTVTVTRAGYPSRAAAPRSRSSRCRPGRWGSPRRTCSACRGRGVPCLPA